MSRQKFDIYYCKNNPDPTLAGTKYKPAKLDMVVMNNDGRFFVYNNEPYYPSIRKLVDVVGNFDVVWKD